MPRRKKAYYHYHCLFGVALTLGSGFSMFFHRFWPDEKGRIIPPFQQIDMQVLPQFQSGISKDGEVVMFEGLPHPVAEPELFAEEMKTKSTHKVKGEHFYLESLPMAAGDVSKLRDLLAVEGVLIEWVGKKFCGGFHPDWMVRWEEPNGGVHEIQLCFGCVEARIYGPGYQLYCDIKWEGLQELKCLLEPYSKHRPPSFPKDPLALLIPETEPYPSPSETVTESTSSTLVSPARILRTP